MKNDIEKIMEELAKCSDRIIVNPETLEELKNQGIPVNVVPSPTIDEGLFCLTDAVLSA
jgi:hypothetical protein